ncbi:hypothetical protein [Aquimarina longa]|uniref:hypothetical protein n=1 Tax=Aquimarina longa TaxID=1080221 RepID=UPI0007851733|nr:hypothetical protein [Aquimarina longa]
MKIKILIIVTFILLVCCKVDSQKKKAIIENKQEDISYSITKNDSLLIEKLVRKVYEWNEKNTTYYFNIGVEDQKGEKYIGIDWSIYEKNKKLLKNSGLFSDIFIDSYRKTLEQIDKKVKNKEYEYDWLIGEYPPFGTDANEWCHCQDIPNDYYWNNIEIKDIEVTGNNTVSLTWNWGKGSNGFNYPIKVKKEDNTWKMTYLDGFDNKYY